MALPVKLSRMKPARLQVTLIIFVLAFTLTACTLWSQSKNPSWTTATGAEQFEKLMYKALKDKNWIDLEAHLSSNFVYLGAEGKMDKDQTMQMFRSADIKDYTLGDFTTTPSGTDIICTYTLTLKGAIAGHPIPESPTRIMTIWQQGKAGWQQIAESEIPMPGK